MRRSSRRLRTRPVVKQGLQECDERSTGGSALGSPGAARARPLAVRLAGGRRHDGRHPRARAALPLRGRAVRRLAPRDRAASPDRSRCSRSPSGRLSTTSACTTCSPRICCRTSSSPSGRRCSRCSASRARWPTRSPGSRTLASPRAPGRGAAGLARRLLRLARAGRLRRRARPPGLADPHRARLLLRHRPALLVAARPERAAAARVRRTRRVRVRRVRLRRAARPAPGARCRSPRTRSTCTSRGASGA